LFLNAYNSVEKFLAENNLRADPQVGEASR
jgi:hypothetical protein